MSRVSFLAEESAILIHAGVLGLQMGLVYDFLRMFRRSFRCNWVIIAIMDLIYWGFVGYRTFFVMHTYSNGVLRWFAVLGAITILGVYLKLFSRWFVSIGTWLLAGIKSIVRQGKKFLTRKTKLSIINLKKVSKERE